MALRRLDSHYGLSAVLLKATELNLGSFFNVTQMEYERVKKDNK